MSKIAYIWKRFNAEDSQLIADAEAICNEYARQGYDLTLRGLYYRLVARDLIPHTRLYLKDERGKWYKHPQGTTNAEPNYKWIGRVLNDARMAGLIDWDHLVDSTRNLVRIGTWEDPADIISAAMSQYVEDHWEGQPEYVEVWVEKEALASIIGRAANAWQVPYFACRGYTSVSEMHVAAMRLKRKEDEGRKVTVIHCGDHDPSGIDMTRDIQDRLATFGCEATVDRIALNMDQVLQYNPPPNPAKTTDSRFEDYEERFGDESWELDALDPADLDALVQGAIREHLDEDMYRRRVAAEESNKNDLVTVSRRWDRVVELINDEPEDDEDE